MASPTLTPDKKAIANDLSKKIIGAAIEVHRILGPGLLESTYEECTYHELSLQKVVLQRQVPLPIQYKGKNLDCGYRLDLVVGQLVIVEFKAVEKIERIHQALEELVSSPAQPTYQATLAAALKQFESAAQKLRTAVTPSQATAIAEMGGADFFEPDIAAKVHASVSTNAMTPSVARDFVLDLVTRRDTFLKIVKSTLQGLDKLNVTQTPFVAGQADCQRSSENVVFWTFRRG